MQMNKPMATKSRKTWIWIVVAVLVIAGIWFFAAKRPGISTGPFDTTTAASEYVHGIVVTVDGTDYYFDGPADGPGGSRDIPGHSWIDLGNGRLAALHYNSGPNNAPQWWSSDAPDGILLYRVDAIVDTWTEAKAVAYAKKGFVHYHELVSVADGTKHPTKVVWLRHIAVTSFTLDGGPDAPNPPYAHEVTPGVDPLFPPQGMTPYQPGA